MNTPEGKVKDLVKRVLKTENVWHYMPMQNGMGVVGIPDIVGCVPVTITEDMVGKTIGVFIGVETKAKGKLNKTTPNQRNVLTQIHGSGGIAIVVETPLPVMEAVHRVKTEGDVAFYLPE